LIVLFCCILDSTIDDKILVIGVTFIPLFDVASSLVVIFDNVFVTVSPVLISVPPEAKEILKKDGRDISGV